MLSQFSLPARWNWLGVAYRRTENCIAYIFYPFTTTKHNMSMNSSHFCGIAF